MEAVPFLCRVLKPLKFSALWQQGTLHSQLPYNQFHNFFHAFPLVEQLLLAEAMPRPQTKIL